MISKHLTKEETEFYCDEHRMGFKTRMGLNAHIGQKHSKKGSRLA